MYYRPGRFLFVRVPRTASGSIRQALTETYGIYDRAPFKGLNKHAFAGDIRSRLGAKAFSACRCFMVVRNPWERMVSIYRWSHAHRITQASFKNWLRQPASHPYLNPGLTQVTWYAEGMEIFRFERMERLRSELGIAMEVLNESGSYSYEDYYDSDSKDLVFSLHRPDIAAFGYEF